MEPSTKFDKDLTAAFTSAEDRTDGFRDHLISILGKTVLGPDKLTLQDIASVKVATHGRGNFDELDYYFLVVTSRQFRTIDQSGVSRKSDFVLAISGADLVNFNSFCDLLKQSVPSEDRARLPTLAFDLASASTPAASLHDRVQSRMVEHLRGLDFDVGQRIIVGRKSRLIPRPDYTLNDLCSALIDPETCECRIASLSTANLPAEVRELLSQLSAPRGWASDAHEYVTQNVDEVVCTLFLGEVGENSRIVSVRHLIVANDSSEPHSNDTIYLALGEILAHPVRFYEPHELAFTLVSVAAVEDVKSAAEQPYQVASEGESDLELLVSECKVSFLESLRDFYERKGQTDHPGYKFACQRLR